MKYRNNNGMISTVLFIIAIMLILLSLSSCTRPKSAERILISAGYHPIEVGGYSFFSCSEDDHFATKFKAYSPDSSRIVTGAVCQGWLKGGTIRLD